MYFVICSSMRTGSHALASALGFHPQLKTVGEIFIRPAAFSIPGNTTKEILEYFQKNWNGFINHRSINNHGRFKDIWNNILAIPGIKVIYLQRKNPVNMFISTNLAMHTKVWQVKRNESNLFNGYNLNPENPEPIIIDPVQFSRCLDAYQTEIDRFDLLLDNPLPVYYEDLNNNWEEEIERIQKFLEISPEKIVPATKKLIGGKEFVQNYEELRKYFENTRWFGYF